MVDVCALEDNLVGEDPIEEYGVIGRVDSVNPLFLVCVLERKFTDFSGRYFGSFDFDVGVGAEINCARGADLHDLQGQVYGVAIHIVADGYDLSGADPDPDFELLFIGSVGILLLKRVLHDEPAPHCAVGVLEEKHK